MGSLKSSDFPRYFHPESLGKSMKEVATDLVYTEHRDVLSRWFHSAQDADLFVWMDSSSRRVIKQQISFYGQVVEWNAVEGVRTGLVIETEDGDRRAARVNASEVVRFDEKPQAAVVEQAVVLLGFVAGFSADELSLLVSNFRGLAGSVTMPADMFAERFGALLSSARGPAATRSSRMPARGPVRALFAWLRRLFK